MTETASPDGPGVCKCMACECEHVAHLDGAKRTPNGNPGHDYGARFAPGYLTEIQTTYGKFRVCRDCATDCHDNKNTRAP
jgi:hypothetical protein